MTRRVSQGWLNKVKGRPGQGDLQCGSLWRLRVAGTAPGFVVGSAAFFWRPSLRGRLKVCVCLANQFPNVSLTTQLGSEVQATPQNIEIAFTLPAHFASHTRYAFS